MVGQIWPLCYSLPGLRHCASVNLAPLFLTVFFFFSFKFVFKFQFSLVINHRTKEFLTGRPFWFCVLNGFCLYVLFSLKLFFNISLTWKSVSQFSLSVMSDSLGPDVLQHDRLPCPSPRAYSNSCLLNQWCHPTSSSFLVPFFSCLQSFPASGSFPRSQFFTSGGQSIGISASASVLPMNNQD